MKSSRKHLLLLLTVIVLIAVNTLAPVFAAPPETYRVEFYVGEALYVFNDFASGDTLPDEAPTLPESEWPDGQRFQGWFNAADEEYAPHEIRDNETYYAKFAPKQYLLVFKDGDTICAGYLLDHGDTIQSPKIPFPFPVLFEGWFNEADEEYTPHPIVSNEVYYAKKGWATATIEFVIGEEVISHTIDYGKKTPEAPEVTPPEGYAFVGFFDDENNAYEQFSLSYHVPQKTYTYYAKFGPPPYTLKFIVGETVLGEYTLNHDEMTPEAPGDPYTPPIIFEGWFNEADEEYVPHKITSDEVYYAKSSWAETTVSFVIGDETITHSVPIGTELTPEAPEVTPPEGYVFVGFFDDEGNLYEPHYIDPYSMKSPDETYTYTARWEPAADSGPNGGGEQVPAVGDNSGTYVLLGLVLLSIGSLLIILRKRGLAK